MSVLVDHVCGVVGDSSVVLCLGHQLWSGQELV